MRPAIVDNVIKMLSCGLLVRGYAMYSCGNEGCAHQNKVPFKSALQKVPFKKCPSVARAGSAQPAERNSPTSGMNGLRKLHKKTGAWQAGSGGMTGKVYTPSLLSG